MPIKSSTSFGHQSYKRLSFIYLILLLWVVGIQSLYANPKPSIEISRFFSNNMVIQRDAPCRIAGKTIPDSKVIVSLGKVKVKVSSDQNGNFLAVLPAQKAGGPYKLIIHAAKLEKVFKNVLVGDVWLCGGQSNMQMSVKNSLNSGKEIASANYDRIRLFNVNNYPDVTAKGKDVSVEGRWLVCTPESIPYFSAVAYYFGREIHRREKVPVGLVETSWGGTPIQSWISYDSLNATVDTAKYAKALDQLIERESKIKAKNLWANIVAREGMNEANKAWAALDYDDTGWDDMPLPRAWESFEKVGNYDGAIWFRKTIDLSEDAAAKDATLSLGPIDDFDITWINGRKVGFTDNKTDNFWLHPRVYKIKADVLQPGKNVITVRVFDHYGGGGFHGKAEQMFLQTTSKKIPLHGNWKYQKGFEIPPEARNNRTDPLKSPGTTTALYNTRIKPLAPFAFKGIIWYQGEANANDSEGYAKLFPVLIRDWRKLFGENLPFIYTQLPNFNADKKNSWAMLRDVQRRALRIAHTAMAITIDLGNPKDIHPKNKQEVGRRLALAALHEAYGKDIPFCGPVVKDVMGIGEGQMKISFHFDFGGLKAKNGTLSGFSVASLEDKKFYPAQAIIKGNTVIVKSDKVEKPAWVKYAWENNPQKPSLYNGAGLPASPFKIDIAKRQADGYP